MSRKFLIPLVGVLPLTLGASQPPVLSQISAGLWEVSAGPAAPPARVCVANPAILAQVEHRGGSCSRTVLRNDSATAVIEYSCGTRGFGHSEIRVLTPRSVRIETQGISNNAPFSYVAQARRMADC